ncbi:FHA domain-containing protein [Phormidesmis priestleyi]
MLILKSVNFEQQEFQNHQLEESYPGQTEWVIGRNTTCDLVLTSPEVSRIHARIVRLDDAYYFVDVGSTSGSLLNGEIVPVDEPRQIHSGDLIQLGETFLHIKDLVAPLSGAMDTIDPSLNLPTHHWAQEDLLCQCCRIIDETPDVKTFCFVSEPPVLFNYKPGQFVNLEVEIDGKPVMRSYSISSSPTRPYHLTLTIKRVPRPSDRPELSPGLVSNWLHDHLNVGDRVKLIGGPMGHFTCLPKLPTKMLMISAGSGITPMMSMVRWMQDTMATSDVIFLHSATSPNDIVFRSELETIAAQMPNLQLAMTITRPSLRHPWMGLTGRISRLMLNLTVPDLLERSVYVCGPGGFMQNVRSLLESMKFPMQNYLEESFGGRSSTVSQPVVQSVRDTEPSETMFIKAIPMEFEASTNGKSAHANQATLVPTIHFIQSDRRVQVDGSASILEIAEEEGIQIRHACRVGACGACKVEVRKGEVRYASPPSALSSADQQGGLALACVACPVGSVAIEA